MYLHTLLSRQEDEITRKTLDKMRDQPLKGDWIFLVVEDLRKIGKNYVDLEPIEKQTKQEYKQVTIL